MSDLRKAAEQSLEYLAAWSVGELPSASAVNDLIADLEAALAQPEQEPEENIWAIGQIEGHNRAMGVLAQPEQEPVAWLNKNGDYPVFLMGTKQQIEGMVPLYTHPPQRKPLTEEEIDLVCAPLGFAQMCPREVARAIEKAHGIGGEE